MIVGEAFLWFAILSSVIVLLGYEIWNSIVVLKDFKRLSQEAKQQNDV